MYVLLENIFTLKKFQMKMKKFQNVCLKFVLHGSEVISEAIYIQMK